MFGILAINEDTVVFAWLFTVLNSLQVQLVLCCTLILYRSQGLFILLFDVVKTEKVYIPTVHVVSTVLQLQIVSICLYSSFETEDLTNLFMN